MTILLVLCLCSITNCYGPGARMLPIYGAEDLDERYLKLINKHPIRSIQTEFGSIIDCVDINSQPAFDQPNHKLQTLVVKSKEAFRTRSYSTADLDVAALCCRATKQRNWNDFPNSWTTTRHRFMTSHLRPAASPTFVLTQHSKSHRKVMELCRQKELLRLQQQQEQCYHHTNRSCTTSRSVPDLQKTKQVPDLQKNRTNLRSAKTRTSPRTSVVVIARYGYDLTHPAKSALQFCHKMEKLCHCQCTEKKQATTRPHLGSTSPL
ncbi:GATA transcription factor 2 [Spatholobus suberectus]|nr:GATA transcription factor 2 [Spatholobus suberectus]